MNHNEKIIEIVAGPNGSGKSTVLTVEKSDREKELERMDRAMDEVPAYVKEQERIFYVKQKIAEAFRGIVDELLAEDRLRKVNESQTLNEKTR